MKGISEIIAIILILMIVIAMAALAYTWFSGIFTTLTGTAGTAVTATTTQMSIQFALEAAACSGAGTCPVGSVVSMTIRNTAQTVFDATKTSFYIDSKSFTGATCSSPVGCTATALANGCIYSCTKTTVAADPSPIKCSTTSPTNPSLMKAVIASGIAQSQTIVC